jgi:hypothetical protein
MTESSTNRLASARDKVRWAKTHVDQLRSEMRDACDGEAPRVMRTTRKFDPDSERVLFIAERVPEMGEDWGLLIGDALHNLRCALDHLWWQLAIDYLGREPTEKEAPRVQFPIIDAVEDWDGHRFLKLVEKQAADKAKTFQAYDRPDGTEAPLSVLGRLSNHDKHRELHPTFFVSTQHGFTSPDPSECRDCEIPNDGGDPPLWELDISYGEDEPKVGDVVLGIRVVPTGPNPDIDTHPEITGQIALRSQDPVFPLMDKLGGLVTSVLSEFAPLLK